MPSDNKGPLKLNAREPKNEQS